MISISLTLNHFDSLSQTKYERIYRIIISHNGDSLISQKYELIIKSKRLYFITPVANYLHVNGGKCRSRVMLDKYKREKIFSLVDQLVWTRFEQTKNKVTGDRYYVIEIFNTDHLIDRFIVSEELLPSDFKTLYDAISDGK